MRTVLQAWKKKLIITVLANAITMTTTRTLTSLVAGAGAAIVALSSVALSLVLSDGPNSVLTSDQRLFLVIGTSAISTILIMSLLHSDLGTLYDRLEASEHKARSDASTDALTSLGNRRFLMEEIARQLLNARSTKSHALLLLDLDDFKSVNDSLGHFAGDELIIQVADRLRQFLGEATLGRLGGDEFAVILEASSDDELAARCADIGKALSGTYQIADQPRSASASIGAAFFADGLGQTEMMRRADIAMYHAKEARSGYQIFDDRMLATEKRRQAIADRLKQTIASGQGPVIAYQPQVNVAGETVGYEALLRWCDEIIGEVQPTELVSVAEQVQLIDEVGLMVAREACRVAAMQPGIPVAINVSHIQLLDKDFSKRIQAVLEECGIGPGNIGLEVSERALAVHGDRVRDTLGNLKALGFSLFVDGFGTGSTSANYLKGFGIDGVKLDSRLLQDARRQGNVAVLRSLVALCHSLELAVCCTGIASAEDRDVALASGCDVLQGFGIAMPSRLDILPPRTSASLLDIGRANAAAPTPAPTGTLRRQKRIKG